MGDFPKFCSIYSRMYIYNQGIIQMFLHLLFTTIPHLQYTYIIILHTIDFDLAVYDSECQCIHTSGYLVYECEWC